MVSCILSPCSLVTAVKVIIYKTIIYSNNLRVVLKSLLADCLHCLLLHVKILKMEVILSSETSVNSVPRSRMCKNLKSSTVKWLRYVLFNSFRKVEFRGSVLTSISLLSTEGWSCVTKVTARTLLWLLKWQLCSTQRYLCRGCTLAARPQNRIPPAGERTSRALVTGRAVHAVMCLGEVVAGDGQQFSESWW